MHASLTLALDGGEWSASLTDRFTPGKRTTNTHWIGGWVGSRTGLDTVPKRKSLYCPCRESNPGPPASNLVNNSLIYLFTYLLTYLLHDAEYYSKSWLHSAYRKISCFLYGTRRFMTVFKNVRHWTPSRTSWIQFVPSIPISLRSSLMLSSHLRLGLPSGLLPSGLPTKTL